MTLISKKHSGLGIVGHCDKRYTPPIMTTDVLVVNVLMGPATPLNFCTQTNDIETANPPRACVSNNDPTPF
jgi:hypothetical protein